MLEIEVDNSTPEGLVVWSKAGVVNWIGENYYSIEGLADYGRIAEKFGVAHTAVQNWRKRNSDFPPAVAVFGKAPVFVLEEVKRWYYNHYGPTKYYRSIARGAVDAAH